MIRILAVAALLAGCTNTTLPSERPGEPNPSGRAEPALPASGKCDASRVQDLIGRQASTVSDEARHRSGATALRSYRQGDPVTMDYREDRLNIETDAAGKILALRCG